MVHEGKGRTRFQAHLALESNLNFRLIMHWTILRIDAVFIRGVPFRLEDWPAVGEGSDQLLSWDRGWSESSSGTVVATRSALIGSNRSVSRARTDSQATIVRRAVAPAHARALRRNLDRR